VFDEERFKLLIKEIQRYPGMYFGKPSFSQFVDFLVGFQTAYDLMDIPLKLFPGFYRFLIEKYPSSINKHQFAIVRQQCKSDREAFYFFFELLDEFLENGGKLSVIHEENIYEEVCEESFENVEENRQD